MREPARPVDFGDCSCEHVSCVSAAVLRRLLTQEAWRLQPMERSSTRQNAKWLDYCEGHDSYELCGALSAVGQARSLNCFCFVAETGVWLACNANAQWAIVTIVLHTIRVTSLWCDESSSRLGSWTCVWLHIDTQTLREETLTLIFPCTRADLLCTSKKGFDSWFWYIFVRTKTVQREQIMIHSKCCALVPSWASFVRWNRGSMFVCGSVFVHVCSFVCVCRCSWKSLLCHLPDTMFFWNGTQGCWHLSSKLFVRSGSRTKSMKNVDSWMCVKILEG